MKTLIITFALLLSTAACAQTTLRMDPETGNAGSMAFETHTNPYTLALNTPLPPIIFLRSQIASELSLTLNFFTGWNPAGEAHVTVITPPEFINVLSAKLTEEDINRIASEYNIQGADLKIMGLGSGKAVVGAETHETFFLIVDSLKLREIRHAIHSAFVKKGGNPSAFDPSWYFPHITVGYTHSDVHEYQGLIKSVKHSWDPRFQIK